MTLLAGHTTGGLSAKLVGIALQLHIPELDETLNVRRALEPEGEGDWRGTNSQRVLTPPPRITHAPTYS
jgi:hypothetical protein